MIEKKFDKIDAIFIVFFGIAIGMLLGAYIIFQTEIPDAEKESYKQGFIDAKIGKQTYQLETQPDSTRLWIKK